jgi:hypothetical protein
MKRYIVSILKINDEDLQDLQTKFQYDTEEQADTDFFYECGNQAKFRGKINGETEIIIWDNSSQRVLRQIKIISPQLHLQNNHYKLLKSTK